MKANLQCLTDIIDDLILDLRYTTSNNICKKKISDLQKPYLTNDAAGAFLGAVGQLRKQGFMVVVWDAYRTDQTQESLRNICKDERFVSMHSNHCLGKAIDVTLADENGNLLDMGTDFDSFTANARGKAREITEQQRANRDILKRFMEDNNFVQLPTEWWHFDFKPKTK